MAVLWMGGEDIDFRSNVTVGTGAGYFRSGYARCYVYSPDQLVKKALAFSGGAVTSCWLSVRYYTASSYVNSLLFGLSRDSQTLGTGIWVGKGDAQTKLAIWTVDGGTTTRVVQSESVMSLNSLHKVDMSVTDFGETAVVKVYLNGTEIVTYSGDIRVGTMTNMDHFVFVLSSPSEALSEIIVADGDTRTLSLGTYAPEADGDTHDWTGTYANVDEITPINDADVIYSNTADQVHQMNLTATPAGTFSVRAVRIAARCGKSSDATPQQVKLGVHATGGSTDDGTAQSLTTAWETKDRLMTVNPITTNPFTTAELDALQVQLKSAA